MMDLLIRIGVDLVFAAFAVCVAWLLWKLGSRWSA